MSINYCIISFCSFETKSRNFFKSHTIDSRTSIFNVYEFFSPTYKMYAKTCQKITLKPLDFIIILLLTETTYRTFYWMMQWNTVLYQITYWTIIKGAVHMLVKGLIPENTNTSLMQYVDYWFATQIISPWKKNKFGTCCKLQRELLFFTYFLTVTTTKHTPGNMLSSKLLVSIIYQRYMLWCYDGME